MGDEGTRSAGAGSWALKGFDYQVDVSVWLALDLMAGARLAAEMTLEHASEEDVEADVGESEPGGVAQGVQMPGGYRLIVQAKRRSGDAWTEAGYRALLTHGERRKSARLRLEEDGLARYLLVTSATLNGPLRTLGVRKAGYWPAASQLPAKTAELGTDLAGRLAIVGGQDDERLLTDIKALLLERFRVPRANWEAALAALREDAEARMRGAAGGRWTREEVEAVIAAHEGFLAGAGHDDYVEPTNWEDLKRALGAHHAIMIVGQSGSGKTATATALWLDLKEKIPDLKRVHITQGPDQLRLDQTPPPVLYEIEDPWGRWKFEPDSRAWNVELASAFESASHDQIFIGTSRSDIAAASGAVESVARWRAPLDAENYGRRERAKLYRGLSNGLPADLRAFAHEHEAAVIQQLSLPLEIRKFFDALPALDRTEVRNHPLTALGGAIAQAHRSTIETNVAQQIGARDAAKPAAIVWAMLKAHDRLSADVLRSIEDPLADRDSALEDALDRFINGFIAARHLRQGADGSLAYAHNKVEGGIEAALAQSPQAVRRTFRHLVEVLMARDDEMGGNWGIETAASVLQLSERIPGATPTLPRATQDRIDAWIEVRLTATGNELDRAISLAAAVGSARSNIAEFARWLEYRPDRTFPAMMEWGKPERDAAWYALLRADPAVRDLAERFVETVIGTDHTEFPERFAEELEPLAGDLTTAFLKAALASAGYGHIRNDEVIAFGALGDLDAFEPIIDAAVKALTPSAADNERDAHNRLLVLNEEVSDEYAEHISNNDDGLTAQCYLHAFARQLRDRRGWRAIASHRHAAALRSNWLRALMHAAAPPAEEVEAAFRSAYGSDDEDFAWALVSKHWTPRYAAPLLDRLTEGAPDNDTRRDALDTLIEHVPGRFAEVVTRLVDAADIARLAELVIDLASRASNRGPDAAAANAPALMLIAQLPPAHRAIAHAEIALIGHAAPDLPADAAAVLEGIADPPPLVRAMRLRLAPLVGLDATDDVDWALAHSDDHAVALNAIEVAIARSMTDAIERALDHRFARVAARALTFLAAPLAAPLPETLLARAERRSSPVRLALIEQLAAKPHADHLSALLLLAQDDWSRWIRYSDEAAHFPVARAAVDAIGKLDTLPDEMLGDFIEQAKTNEDKGVVATLLALVVWHGSEARQAEVAEMARRGSRIVVGEGAAYALFDGRDRLAVAVRALIADSMVLQLPASIAGYHLLTLGLTGDDAAVDGLADKLSSSDDRRIFLAMLAMAVRQRDAAHADLVAARLPQGHVARRWAEGEAVAIEREMLIDLGDASAVKEALVWMKSPTKS